VAGTLGLVLTSERRYQPFQFPSVYSLQLPQDPTKLKKDK
jgi:hypothetical protein